MHPRYSNLEPSRRRNSIRARLAGLPLRDRLRVRLSEEAWKRDWLMADHTKDDIRRLISTIRSSWEESKVSWQKLGKAMNLYVPPRTI